jgi:centromere protein C
LASVRRRGYVQEEEEEPEDGATRRSGRVTKGKRFAFWKNERPVYNGGQLVGILAAEPTPAKRKLKRRRQKQWSSSEDDDEEEKLEMSRGKSKSSRVKPPAKVTLPQDVTYIPPNQFDKMSVWDESKEAAVATQIICQYESLLPATKLPISGLRKPGHNVVGSAMQSFNIAEDPIGRMCGWISGFLELPPGGIKGKLCLSVCSVSTYVNYCVSFRHIDAEPVGECSQVFFISSCQAGSVEFGLSDPLKEVWDDDIAQRVIVTEGDSFHVPPGNIYRLENHSTEQTCRLFWTIMKPYKGS